MFMHIFMLAFLLPIPLIIFFVLRNEVKPKKNLVLGVTLPLDRREDPAVAAEVKRFLRMEDAVLALIALLIAPQFFFSHESVVLTWWFTWMILAIALPWLPYASGNGRLRELKRKNGWFGASAGVTLVDTKVTVAPKKLLSVWVFIPPFLMTLVPVAAVTATLRGKDEFWPLLGVFLTMTVTVAVFYFLYRLIYRQKADVVDGSTAISAALTQIRRYNWSKCWIWAAWLTGLFDLALWLLRENAAVLIGLTAVYTVALLTVLLRAEFKTRKMQQKLTRESGRDIYTDDDDLWPLGMVYYNRNDSHLMVNKRVGVGMTFNMAKAPAKIIAGFVVLVMLSMPLIGILMMRSEFTPVSLVTDGGWITAIHAGAKYTIEADSVTSAYLLDRLPDGTRTNGTALKTVLKGSFRYDGIGDCRLCLDPRVPPFLVIEAAGHTYILGSSEAGETNEAFELLTSRGVQGLRDNK